jgi:hypothetical protein
MLEPQPIPVSLRGVAGRFFEGACAGEGDEDCPFTSKVWAAQIVLTKIRTASRTEPLNDGRTIPPPNFLGDNLASGEEHTYPSAVAQMQ